MKKSERLKTKRKINYKCFLLAHILTLFFVVVPIASATGNIFYSEQKNAYSEPFSKLIEFLNAKKNELEKYDGDFLGAKAFLSPAEEEGRNNNSAVSETNFVASSFVSAVFGSVKSFVVDNPRQYFGNVFESVKNFVFPGDSQNSFEYKSPTSEENAKEIEKLKQQYASAIDETNAISQKFNLLQVELGKIKNSGAVVSQPSADQRALENTIGIIEKIVSGQSASSGLSQNDLDSKISEIRSELNNLNTNLTSQINSLSSNTSRQTSAAFSAISLTNRIDNLSGTRLSSITVSGVSGLTDADIPDSITASNYLPLAGGTLTGALTGTSASFSSTLTVSASTTLNGVEYKWPSSDGTANQSLITNGSGGLSWSTISGSGVPDWNQQTNYGTLTLTTTTTIPIWAKSAIYASSTLTVQGNTSLANSSTTALTVSGSTFLTDLGQGWLHTAGGTNALTSSTSPTVAYLTATSTTATSTLTDLNFPATTNLFYGGQRFLTASTTSAGNLTIGYQSATNIDRSGGLYNTGLGYQVMGNATSSPYNTAFGYQALKGSATITSVTGLNTAFGFQALTANTTGNKNAAMGAQALKANTTGINNLAIGNNALLVNTTGNSNAAIGSNTLTSNVSGDNNVGIGTGALQLNTADNNIGIGYASFNVLTSGTGNAGIGYQSGYGDGTADQRSVTDNYMTFIGYQASRDASIASTTALSNGIAIGKNARVAQSNAMVLGGTGADAVNVGIGTTSPWAKLSIMNTYGSLTPLFDIATSTSVAYATSSIFRVNANGNIGIGTTSPNWKLSVAGHGSFDDYVRASYFTATSTTLASTFAYNVGIGTTSPYSRLSVSGDTALDSMLINFASSSASSLTLNYLKSATSTIPSNTNYAWSIATSTTASPIFSISTQGSGASLNATTTINGGLNLDNGALLYDYSSGITTINSLEAGPMSFDDNAGIVSWMDMGITSASAVNTKHSYTAQIDSNPILTVYGESDGSGTTKNLRVGIGTTTPSNSLSIHNATTTADADLGFTATSTNLASWYNWTMGIDISDGGKFKIASSTALGTSDRLTIDGSGSVGIGTTSPWRTLSVSGTVGFSSSLSATTTNAYDICIDAATFEITQRTTDCSGASSLRYKQNVEKLSYGLNDLMKLNPVSFQYTEAFAPTDRKRKIGFIAEEVEAIIPEIVAYDDLGRPDSLDYPKLTSLLAKAIQELNLKVIGLEASVASSSTISNEPSSGLFTWITDKFKTLFGITFEKDTIKAKNICVGETCVTEEQFKTVFGSPAGAQGAQAGSSQSASSSSSSQSSASSFSSSAGSSLSSASSSEAVSSSSASEEIVSSSSSISSISSESVISQSSSFISSQSSEDAISSVASSAESYSASSEASSASSFLETSSSSEQSSVD